MKKMVAILICSITVMTFAFAQVDKNQKTIDSIQSAVLSSNAALVQGLQAYKDGDWNTALLFLRKAVSEPEYSTADTWYVMIMSELFSQDYESAVKDCSLFLSKFPYSNLVAQVEYQKARAFFLLALYDNALLEFSHFCQTYPSHELVSSSYFWMAESLYQSYKFSDAKKLFTKVVNEYPLSAKFADASYRVALLDQREREEKLLYLLRVTGEEYLAAKEEYERKLKLYENEDAITMRNTMQELKNQLEDLKLENDSLKEKNTALSSINEDLRTSTEDAIQELKIAAAERQAFMAGAGATGTVDTSAFIDESLSADETVVSQNGTTKTVAHSEAFDALLKKAAELEELLKKQEE